MPPKPPSHAVVAQAMDQAQRLRAAGRIAEALRAIQPAIASGFGPAHACAFAGRLYLEQGRHDRAIELLGRASALVPTDRNHWFSLMLARKRAGQVDEVLEACRVMVEGEPAYLEGAALYADVLHDLGRDAQACEVLDRLVEHLPDADQTPEQRIRLACVRSLVGGVDPREVASRVDHAGQEMLSDPKFSNNAQAKTAVSQAMSLTARALDRDAKDEDDRKRVLDLLGRAKSLRNGRFDGDAHDRRVDHALEHWANSGERAPMAAGVDGSPLVLIVGMPRSGTSILEQMLACHSEITPRGERSELSDVARQLTQHRDPTLPVLVTEPTSLDPQGVRVLGEQFLARLVGDAKGLVTTKLPFDFLHVPLAARLAPGCRVIHIRRDPVDTCWSGYLQWFNRLHPHTLTFEGSGRYYRAYDRLMRGYANLAEPVRPAMYELEYETLVRETEPTMRSLLEWLGLDWQDSVLRPEKSDRIVMTASREQVRTPINPSSIGRAKAYGGLLDPLRDAIVRA